MVRIEAPHFVAGIVRGDLCAQIIHYMRGWTLKQIHSYCANKGWKCDVYR